MFSNLFFSFFLKKRVSNLGIAIFCRAQSCLWSFLTSFLKSTNGCISSLFHVYISQNNFTWPCCPPCLPIMSFLQDVFIGRIVCPCSCNWQNQEGWQVLLFLYGLGLRPTSLLARAACVPLLVQNNILAACFECHQPRAVFFFFNNFNFAKPAKVFLKMKTFYSKPKDFPKFFSKWISKYPCMPSKFVLGMYMVEYIPSKWM